MDGAVQALLQNCALCTVHSKSAKPCRPPLQTVPMPSGPWSKLVLDAIGPLKGPSSERFGLVLVDAFSRWPEVAFMSEVTSSAVIEFLQAVFAREGIPQELLCDNGSVFTSSQFQGYCTSQGIKLIHSIPYSPQTCGLVERFNRTVKDAVESARLEGQSRAPYVRAFLQTYRATIHPATGQSPFHLMRGRDMRTKLSAAGVGEIEQATQNRDSALRSHLKSYQDRYVARYNERAGEVKFNTGDLVRVKAPFGWKRRFGPPLLITGQLGPVTFLLSDGQKVHARRLAAAKGADRRKTETADDEEVWYPEQTELPQQTGNSPSSVPSSSAPRPATPTTSEPRLGRGCREKYRVVKLNL